MDMKSDNLSERVLIDEFVWVPSVEHAIGYRQMVDIDRARLATLAEEFPGVAGPRIEVGSRSIWRGIVELASQAKADLIVLASHRPAMKDYLLGTNAVSVVRHAPCSVMVVRA